MRACLSVCIRQGSPALSLTLFCSLQSTPLDSHDRVPVTSFNFLPAVFGRILQIFTLSPSVAFQILTSHFSVAFQIPTSHFSVSSLLKPGTPTFQPASPGKSFFSGTKDYFTQPTSLFSHSSFYFPFIYIPFPFTGHIIAFIPNLAQFGRPWCWRSTGSEVS